MSTAGYCFFCDVDADRDPCPRCGRDLYRSPVHEVGRLPIDLPKPVGQIRAALLLLAIALLLLVIAAVASFAMGIT